jgi:hypothetical protein
MPAPIVIFLGWVGTKTVTAAASAAVSKLASIPVDKALSIQVQGASVGAWGETIVLAVFAGQSLTPEPTFEQKVSLRFDDFDDTLDLTKPGEHYLKGAYRLNAKLPNPSLGGRPLAVEIEATLTPVS